LIKSGLKILSWKIINIMSLSNSKSQYEICAYSSGG
jgi:hypothetical protein